MAVNPAIAAYVQAEQAKLDKMNGDIDSITSEFAALNKQIQDLNNAPGNLGPEDNQALADFAAKSAALNARLDALVVPATVTPPPATP